MDIHPFENQSFVIREGKMANQQRLIYTMYLIRECYNIEPAVPNDVYKVINNTLGYLSLEAFQIAHKHLIDVGLIVLESEQRYTLTDAGRARVAQDKQLFTAH